MSKKLHDYHSILREVCIHQLDEPPKSRYELDIPPTLKKNIIVDQILIIGVTWCHHYPEIFPFPTRHSMDGLLKSEVLKRQQIVL